MSKGVVPLICLFVVALIVAKGCERVAANKHVESWIQIRINCHTCDVGLYQNEKSTTGSSVCEFRRESTQFLEDWPFVCPNHPGDGVDFHVRNIVRPSNNLSH